MANRAPATKRPTANPWVPRGFRAGATPKAARKSADANEWLPAARPGSDGHNGHSGGNGSGSASSGAKPDPTAPTTKSRRRHRRHKLPKRATPRERWLILRLRRSKRRLEEQAEEIERLERRLSDLEASTPVPNGNGSAPATKPTRKPSAMPASAKRASSSNGRAPKRTRTRANGSTRARGAKAATSNGRAKKQTARLDLNGATFDELRGLGLSITQCSRLISYREADGGFASVDDLGEIKGLARGTVAKLRSQVRVAARA